MAVLILSRGNEILMRFPLAQERVTIGRDVECDIVLDDSSISRHHFDLTWDGRTYQLTDLSRNGTFLAGERVSDSVPLDDGSQIELGDYHFVYHIGHGGAAEVTADREQQPTMVLKYEPTTKALTLEQITMTVTSPSNKQEEYVFDRLPITIGATPQNAIVIQDDPYISRQHCRIETGTDGLRLRDCQSRNGTWWGKSQIQSKLLPEQGNFQVGKTLITYQVKIVTEALRPTPQQRCGELLGASRAMHEVFALVNRVAPSEATILISGASGTGKELLARAIHAASGRANRQFVAINCGAIPATIIESELFGHERGAFTGATTQHKGVFEQAQGGTLFLDEIGEMPLELQTRLLRVLETKSIRRVGGTQEVAVDVRIVAATHQVLADRVQGGSFREDLYYRLYMVPIHIPPLRERPEDLLLLARHFLQTFSPPGHKRQFTREAEAALLAHTWPGNVRELRHTIERLVLHTTHLIVQPEDIQFMPMRPEAKTAITPVRHTAIDLKVQEQQLIEQALRVHRGNISRAARALGIARSTLTLKAQKFAIDLKTLREQG